MSAGDVQGWMIASGVLGTAIVSCVSLLVSVKNNRALTKVSATVENTDARHIETVAKIDAIELATNGMKKDLEDKAFEAGARSVEDGAIIAARAAEVTAEAARVVADAAKTAADLVAASAGAKK